MRFLLKGSLVWKNCFFLERERMLTQSEECSYNLKIAKLNDELRSNEGEQIGKLSQLKSENKTEFSFFYHSVIFS